MTHTIKWSKRALIRLARAMCEIWKRINDQDMHISKVHTGSLPASESASTLKS